MSGASLGTILAVAGLALAVTGFMLAFLMVVYERRRAARYDQEHRRAELDLMRRSTETKINELTERLLATEARWRDTNHLLLDSQSYQQDDAGSRVELNGFLKSAGVVASDLDLELDLVFVLMPFHPDFRRTFAVIKDVCSELGLRAVRGDEEYVSSDILSHIIKLLVKARLVIAVIDGRNPNVFYELGIAHALDKTTILVSADSSVDLPFDVRARRVVLAKHPKDLSSRLAPEIARALVQR